jgi:hypothetical protein
MRSREKLTIVQRPYVRVLTKTSHLDKTKGNTTLLKSKAPTITRLNGFVSIFIHKRLRYCLPFNQNDCIVLQNFFIIACNHGF